MRKNHYFFLILIPVFLVSLSTHSQTLFRSGKFLHHSTGGNIWGPNGSSTSIPNEIALYNAAHGYTGNNAVSMTEQWWPGAPLSNDNEWERWHRIFDGEDPYANIQPIMTANKIVVIKSCYPSSAMTGMGQPSDTLTYTIKSMYNYKWHMRNIVNVMAQHPENFFAIWTNAPLNQAATNANAAMLAKKFTTWMKDTLAVGLDPVMGAFPPNIYIFNYFAKLTNASGYQMPEYAVSTWDSHPNSAATALVAPQFVNEIFDAAIAYEQGGNTLSVSPASRNVTAAAGSTTFTVTSNTTWTALSNAGWCTVTSGGTGNGTITATFTANTNISSRTATITVSASGANSQTVTVVQAGATPTLSVSPSSQSVTAAAGTTNFTVTSNTSWTALSNAGWCTVTTGGTGNGTITATFTANTELSSRTATITVSASGANSQTVTVVQAGATPALSVSPSSQSVTAAAGTTNFTVTSNTSWTAQSNAGWCTVTSGGTGNGTITATFTANTELSSRTATITVSASGANSQTVTVVQAGATPALSVSPSSQSVTAAAGTTNFTVTSNTSWTALSNAGWCTVTSGGTGNGTITATFTANTNISSRTATITVSASGANSQTVTVVQAGTSPTLTVSPSSQSVTAAAGTTNFTVTSNTTWTAQSNAGWCTVTSGGTGNGTITATFTANTELGSRTATITVSASGAGSQTVTVVQAGTAPTLTVSPSSQSVTAAAGTTNFTVTSNTSWTAQSNAGWCTVTSGGTGNGTITATFTANTELSSRTATITVSASGANSQTVTVVQAGATPALSVSPSSQSVTAAAGTTNFTVTSNTSWTALSNAGWCTVTTGGTGNGTITATFTANTDLSSRTATITVSASGANSQTVTVVQAGATPTLSVSPSSQSVTAAAGTTNFTVTSNTTWTAQSNAGWCTVTSGGTGNGIITATFTANTDLSSRTATITVSASGANSQTVTVVQAGATPTLSVSPSSQSVTAAAGTTNFTVTSNTTWTALSNAGWCTVTSGGTGDGTLIVNYEENTATSSRSAVITVSADGVNDQVVTVDQIGTDPALSVSPSNQEVSHESGTTEFTIASNIAWNAVSDVPWCTVTNSGSGSGILTAVYEGNQELMVRTATITISAAGLASQLVTVTQSGTPVTLTVSPGVQYVASSAGDTTYSVFSNAAWSASSSSEWCLVTSEGSGNGILLAQYEENPTIYERSGTILVSAEGAEDQLVLLVQAGAEPLLLPGNDSLFVGPESGYFSLDVTCNSYWYAQSDAEWCKTTSSGNGNGMLYVAYDENETAEDRSANIILTGEASNQQVVKVFQQGVITSATRVQALPLTIFPNPSSGSFTITGYGLKAGITFVSLNDMTGRPVFFQVSLSPEGLRVDATGAAEGLYILTLSNGTTIYQGKILIK